jgi:hypothetical protein
LIDSVYSATIGLKTSSNGFAYLVASALRQTLVLASVLKSLKYGISAISTVGTTPSAPLITSA